MQSKTNLVDVICLDLGPSALFHLHLEPPVLKHVESRVSVGWCCVHCSSWNDVTHLFQTFMGACVLHGQRIWDLICGHRSSIMLMLDFVICTVFFGAYDG